MTKSVILLGWGQVNLKENIRLGILLAEFSLINRDAYLSYI